MHSMPAPLNDPPRMSTLLNVNGIEVIYNHVILVLKGVSLTVCLLYTSDAADE